MILALSLLYGQSFDVQRLRSYTNLVIKHNIIKKIVQQIFEKQADLFQI
jgi:hypothetical protein